MEWIRAALSYLQDDASIWAAPAMEEFADGGIPFGGLWATFREQFKAWFETVDEAVDAKEKLRVLWQDNSSVPEYAALFKELMARTGYSSVDLRDRFYEHLSTRIKDELVHTARPIGTLDELVTVASGIDVRVHQRRAEKEREKKRSGVTTGMTTSQAPLPGNLFVSPNAEPVAMDVNATHTRKEFIRRMRGKCFGCGSGAHTKKEGGHERDLCAHCKHVGHQDIVCMDKFLGRAKGQKAAAASGENEVELIISDELSKMSEGEGVAATTSITLAQLVQQQKVLGDQIVALREMDF
jgi:hypothetical protein